MVKEKRSSFEIAYEEAFSLACKEFLQKDVYSCCINAGAEVFKHSEDSFNIKINFLNRPVNINIPEFAFSLESPDNIGIWEKILILHYLSNSDETPLTNSLINYKQVKSGSNYFPTFEKRSIKPLISSFGKEPHLLIESSKQLGGEEVSYGDFGVKITAFPFVPIFLVIWKGDEEFPATGNILFDSSIEKRLSAEDIAVMCQQIVFKIIKIKNKTDEGAKLNK
jgi:hypothetical protein